jgi:hypothetical protein
MKRKLAVYYHRMKNPFIPIGFLGATLFFGCATPYTGSGLLGGYSDTAFAPDVYRISFQGNGYTSQERTQDFAILRAADLTLSHGYRYFGIINQTEGGRSGVINTPGQSYTYVNAQQYGNFVYGTAHSAHHVHPWYEHSLLLSTVRLADPLLQ